MALKRIVLRDFVIVSELELDLESGFSVLTGETGAGKSILIDALQLVTGARADTGVIREGAARTDVSAEFDNAPGLQAVLDDAGFEAGDTLLLRRTVDTQGKSRAWVNGSPATAQQLRTIGEQLLDIHGQHAWQSLTRPEAVRGQPDLHVRLYAESVKDLKAFLEGAQADRTEAGGDQGMPAYESLITFDTPVETGKLFSLARSDYEFTGGAHGNTAYTGVLWDKAMKRPVTAAGLLKPGVALSALDGLLCTAVNAEKKKRDPQAETISLNPKDASGWSCPHAADTPIVLAPSTEPGKAGGLVFLVGPYQVGPYAEGSYQVPVPQAAIRSLLAPAYADEFAGAPVMPKG
ncbi:MAG: DUF4163 domain-containing protein [Betaproteobacteria bacterium]|nr:DUF4163 domain-containing protein [Betaproteobacteria bacterium]